MIDRRELYTLMENLDSIQTPILNGTINIRNNFRSFFFRDEDNYVSMDFSTIITFSSNKAFSSTLVSVREGLFSSIGFEDNFEDKFNYQVTINQPRNNGSLLYRSGFVGRCIFMALLSYYDRDLFCRITDDKEFSIFYENDDVKIGYTMTFMKYVLNKYDSSDEKIKTIQKVSL